MIFSFILLFAGMLVGGAAAIGLGLLAYRRLQRRFMSAVRVLMARQMARQAQVSGKLTGIIVQLQENQAKQHEQLHKLAEFSMRLKKEMAIVSARQDDDESDWINTGEETSRTLN